MIAVYSITKAIEVFDAPRETVKGTLRENMGQLNFEITLCTHALLQFWLSYF